MEKRKPFGSDELLFNAFLCLDTYLGRPRVNRSLRRLRRWNQDRLLARAQAAAREEPPRPVPVFTDLPAEEFRSRFLRYGEPVVIKGFAKNFPAVGRWSPEFFRSHYGNMPVQTVDGEHREVKDHEAGIGEVHIKEMTVAEQVDRMLEGSRDYVSFWTELFTQHPELNEDIDVARLRDYIRPRLWKLGPIFKFFMGAGGTSTGWHCAELQNLFVQIHGTKEWQFCPPSWTPCLDPRVVTLSQQYCHSMIDFRAPDLETYPLYEYAPLRRVVLEPGDVLYVPPFWWHCVYNPEVSIGLAVWWINVMPALRSHPTLLWLTVLSPQHLFRQLKERLQRKDPRTAVTTSSIFRAHGRR